MNLPCVQMDLARCKYLQALQAFHRMNAKEDMVIFTTPPSSMFAGKALEKSEFQCAPLVPLQYIVVAESNATLLPTGHHQTINGKKVQIFLGRPALPSSRDLAPEGRAPTCAMYTFFWCRDCKTADLKHANVKMTSQSFQEFTIPMIHNHVAIPMHQQMLLHVKPRDAPKSSVIMAQDPFAKHHSSWPYLAIFIVFSLTHSWMNHQDSVAAPSGAPAPAPAKAPAQGKAPAPAQGKAPAPAKAPAPVKASPGKAPPPKKQRRSN